MKLFEEPTFWSTLERCSAIVPADKSLFWLDDGFQPDETSVILHLYGFRARKVRDWLHREKYDYQITALCYLAGLARAVRFRFATPDDRFLFTLRWL